MEFNGNRQSDLVIAQGLLLRRELNGEFAAIQHAVLLFARNAFCIKRDQPLLSRAAYLCVNEPYALLAGDFGCFMPVLLVVGLSQPGTQHGLFCLLNRVMFARRKIFLTVVLVTRFQIDQRSCPCQGQQNKPRKTEHCTLHNTSDHNATH
ncbi:hypothetical protein HFD92_07125 [Pantoea sp. EKM101V]|uniref:hypothetical protein n=1 Tax=Pantoea sp. EKM101V TaxID=1683695 RepID=UPI00142D6F28|nr:hypothetical protein [Pantoea sp. EKM101V]KAF6666543.1 hypothetical protein HFD92_07125 [Pantoea sp. EKM101V]